MATLIIPTPLRKFTGNLASFESSGQNVHEIVDDLIQTYRGLQKHLLDDSGKLRSFIRIYVGDTDIQSLDQELTLVPHDGTVSIIPAIAGGSH